MPHTGHLALLASPRKASVQGVNSKGFAVGYWVPAEGAPHGFFRTK